MFLCNYCIKWTHEGGILGFIDANDISHSKSEQELEELNEQIETEYKNLKQRAKNNVEIITKKPCNCTVLTYELNYLFLSF